MKYIRIGIVGLGRLGLSHAEKLAYRVPGAQLCAVCRRSETGLADLGARLGLEVDACYTDYTRMLAEADLDAVVVCSPSEQHPLHIEQALNAGKHVFSEKPLAVDDGGCRRAQRAVACHGELVFMLGLMRRYDPSVSYAKACVERGDIGMPYLFKGTGLDPQSSVEEMLRYTELGSGNLLTDLGTHDIDLMRYFLGEDPEEVYAIGGSYAYPLFSERGDAEAAVASFRFPSGKMAVLHCGRAAAHGYHVETEIVGTEGSIRVGPVPEKNLAKLYGKQGVLTECVEGFLERYEQAYLIELTEFVDCVRTGRKPMCTAEDGAKAAIIARAAAESLKTKRPVRIRYA